MTDGSQAAGAIDVETQEPKRDVSRVASAQRAILTLTEILEDSVELFGATVREEAQRIPGRFLRPAAGFLSVVIGALFLTAAAALYLRDLFGGWHLSFLSLGALYVLLALVFWNTGPDRK